MRQVWGAFLFLIVIPVSALWAEELPPVMETYPQSGVVGQPRRVTEKQNRMVMRHQGNWGRFNWGNGEFVGFGPVGVYGVAPWAEDWSALRDPVQRHDCFDPLKFVALNETGSIWLSLSGESRVRNWYEVRPALGSVGHDNAGRFAVRNLYGSDLHMGQHFRLFGQAVNGEAAGWKYYGYGPAWRQRLGLQQLFVEIKGHISGAKSGLMLGRQQFLDAPSWLLYNRETPNVPLSWNGIRGYAVWDSVRVDGYNFIATQIDHDRLFGGGFDDATRLYGVDITTAFPLWLLGHQEVHSFLDIFWIGSRFNGVQAKIISMQGSRSGTQTRQSVGFRWYGSVQEFESDISAVIQFGRFFPSDTGSKRSIRAYAARLVLGWRHPASFLHPFVGMQAEIYSGSHASRRSGAIQGFVAPFSPQTGTFDTTLSFARENLMSLGPVLSLTPRPYVSLRVRVPFLWRQKYDDGLYGSSGRYAFLSGALLHKAGRWVGYVPQGSVQVQVNQHLEWQMDGGVVFLGSSLRHMGGKGREYMLSSLIFRF